MYDMIQSGANRLDINVMLVCNTLERDLLARLYDYDSAGKTAGSNTVAECSGVTLHRMHFLPICDGRYMHYCIENERPRNRWQ